MPVAMAFCLCIAMSKTVLAQIPNAGFEQWTNSNDCPSSVGPIGWETNNFGCLWTPIQKTTQSHSDSFAVYGQTTQYSSFLILPSLSANFSVNYRPLMLKGYYQFSPRGGDTLLITIDLFRQGTQVAHCSLGKGDLVTTYSQFALPINYLTNDTPDSCVILIQMIITWGPDGPFPAAGSYFFLDDLTFSGVSAVADRDIQLPLTPSLSQNYPNPFNPTTTIEFQISRESQVTLKFFDILGREVTTLVNERMGPGAYTRTFNGTDLPSGVYLYRLQADQFVQTRNLLLIR